MRSFMKLVLAAALSVFSSAAASAIDFSTLTVHVQDGAGSGVKNINVAAINFGMNGPSTYTQVGVTNVSGNASFLIVPQMSYNLFVSSHGYSPTIADQFNNPEYDPNRYVWTMSASQIAYSTFTVAKDQVNVGRIVQPFTGATANRVLFGGIYNMAAQMPGPSGLIFTGTGNGTLVIDNVPFADANTYNIGMYDPEKDRGIGRNVMSPLDVNTPLVEGIPTITYSAISFNNAVPPARVETAPGGGGAATAGASVEGVVVSTNSRPIPHMGISVKACGSFGQWNSWANTDESGRFQLYGLTLGTTYYLNVMGGCTWDMNGPGPCYEPYSSPQYNAQDICNAAVGAAAVNINDIVYKSSDIVNNFHSVKLDEMPKSSGKISVYVRSNSGQPIPNSMVNVNPDGSPWPKSPASCANIDNFNMFYSSPGFANSGVNAATGYALLDGLPSGNYMINVWTPFSSGGGDNSFNGGADSKFGFGMMPSTVSWNASHCAGYGSADDYRVTVDTNPLTNGGSVLHVYNAAGVSLNLSSITYIVSAGGNTSGEVKGVLKFPGITDLRENPVSITLFPQCMGMGPCPAGNFQAIASSGASSYPYTINVSSGFVYYMNVSALNWGRVNKGGGNSNINLAVTSSVVANMEFAPAGTVTGTVYKPDGTIFTPSANQYIWIDVNNQNGWSGTQLEKDGTFTMSDVLPGQNRFMLMAGGGPGGIFSYALPVPAPTVDVVAGMTVTQDLKLVDAKYVGIQTNMAWMPDRTVIGSGWNQLLGFKTIPLPAGSVFNSDTIMGMFKGGDGDRIEFRYSTGTRMGEEGPCGQGWSGGFCAQAMPTPSIYDFYLVRQGDFGDMQSGGVGSDDPYPHFVVLSSSKNVIVDSAHANATVYSGGGPSTHTAAGVLVDLTPSANLSARGNATLYGQVTASNFFRQADYDGTGGDMNKFMEFLPLVSLYDANGAFKAAGIVLPPPAFIKQKEQTNQFSLSMAQGYAQFKALLDQASYFGYEIRGLAPSTCYTAVMTTPNYPPYQSRVCTGVNGSTTTLSINLDIAVGAGATLQGVVRTTNSVVLAGAVVDLSSEGMDPKSAVTDNTGAYLFQGLPPGTLKVRISAEGYAPANDEIDAVGSNIYTQNYALKAAGGSITGTVYSQKLPYAKVQAGAQIVAYDDTYNGLNPNAPLPLIKAKTGSDGTYRLTGLIPGDVYKVFLKVAGKYTLTVATTAVNGVQPNIDFTMLPKPLDIEIFAKKTETDFEFTVLNPQDFKDGWAGYSVSPFNGVSASTVTLTKLSSGELTGKIPLSALASGQVYVLRGIARSYSGKQVMRDLPFGKSYKGNTEQQIDDAILGDDSDDGTGRKLNEVAMDKSGDDASGIMFPPGAVLPVSTGAIPTCSFKGEDKDDASVKGKVDALGADAFAGNLYTVSLASVTANANKTIELTLAYDKSSTKLDDLSVARYNDTSGKWEQYTGVATVNPVKGTVKVKLKNLASVLNVRGSGGLQVNSFDGRQYSVRPSASGSGSSGTFAVVRPSIAGNAYAGTKLKVFNYPNPFSLKSKAISNNQGAALPGTTHGTVIHVEVPAGNGGPGHIRIYNLAGELVNDLQYTFTAGTHNYVLWNGHNTGGQPVANGVYYGVVELSGKSPDRKDATFKMAVIK